MKSYARLALLALAALAGLVLTNQRSFYAQTTVQTEAPPGTLKLGRVKSLGKTNCLYGAPKGADCTEIQVSCPGLPGQPDLPNLDATLAVSIPSGPSIGTVVLHSGGPGIDFLDSGFPDKYLADGFSVVQIAWASDWANANGAGVKSAACRPATVFYYAFQTVQHASKSTGFCGQGGGAALGYSLAYYGLSDEFDYVVIASGPGASRMDYGCDPPLYTGPALNLCPLLTNAPFAYSAGDASKVNTWEGTTTCGTLNPPPNDIDRWAADSIVSPDGNYTYPQTAMSWFFCVTQPGVNSSTGQGTFLIDQAIPMNPADVNCYSGTCQGEGVWQDPVAAELTANEMLSKCQANH